MGDNLTYTEQPNPDGLAQAFILAEDFLDGAPSALILGDNIFVGHGLPELLAAANAKTMGATVFGYRVTDPKRYGVVGFDNSGNVNSIVEKPSQPASNYAVTGLCFFDGTASERAKKVQPSARGELEITSLLESYLEENNLNVHKMGRGFAWLDAGTHDSLLDAANFVRTLIERQGLQIGAPEVIAYANHWIETLQLRASITELEQSAYGKYLSSLLL